jgi:hypothetical protein
MRRASTLAFAAVALLAACGIQDSYPLPTYPPGAAAFHPVAVGETVSEAVLFIEAREGTRVEIVSAEPVGQLEGVTVDFSAASLLEDAEGGVVVGDERVELEGSRVEELADASADPPANTIGVVAEITASEPGRFVLTGVRLSYRINGAPERDGVGIDVVVTVCADDQAPAECGDEAS